MLMFTQRAMLCARDSILCWRHMLRRLITPLDYAMRTQQVPREASADISPRLITLRHAAAAADVFDCDDIIELP